MSSKRVENKKPTRRHVLRAVAFSAIAFSGQGALVAGTRNRPRIGVTVFRLRTRGTRACRACQEHHRYKVFISFAHCDRGRAHPGCNCPITKQKISLADFKRLFIDTRSIRKGEVDLRHLD